MASSVDIPFSVLDLAPVANGSSVQAALRNSRDLAQQVERLGYKRYWFAEHHNMPGVASAAPVVLIGHIAAATTTLRVGSGGVMLPNHAPLVVAEQFGTLEALHPGRIDLGLGRAPGTDQATARALRRTSGPLSADDFPQQLVELLDYFGGPVEGEPEPPDLLKGSLLAGPQAGMTGRTTAVTAVGNRPPVWLLGSSGFSAQVAGLLGLPFAFAHHFSPENTLPALKLYRENFRPSVDLDTPYAMVAASVLCADSDKHAKWLAGPQALSFLRVRTNRPGALPSPEEAAAYPYTPIELQFVRERASSQIVGSPETVRRSIDELLASTAADELMVTTITYDHADRVRSYELLAETVGLVPPDGPRVESVPSV